MSKELKIKGNLSKDYQQIYIDDEPTNLFLNKDGKIKTAAIKQDVLGEEVEITGDKLIAPKQVQLTYDDENRVTLRVADDGHLAITGHGTDDDLTLDFDGSVIIDSDANVFTFKDNGTSRWEWSLNTFLVYGTSGGVSDYFGIVTASNGLTSLVTNDGTGDSGHMTLLPQGDLKLDPTTQKIIINATDKLYFDGGTDTYIYESSADTLRVVVGNDVIMQISEQGLDGNQVYFDNASVGFQQLEPTYDATNTFVDFRHSNKQNFTFDGGSVTNINLQFPEMSGNFVLLVKQDGTGSRTITNWKVQEFDESGADGSAAVVWAGGSAPTLTTDANHVDILSFYWDADNEICYGVATLDFQF